MRYSSVVNYYQTVIFYHDIKGRAVARWSDPMLAQTVKGIKNLETVPEDVKDPLTEKHLKLMFREVIVKSEHCMIISTMIIFLFRTLLRVGHAVVSPHTLRMRDVKIFQIGCLGEREIFKNQAKGLIT